LRAGRNTYAYVVNRPVAKIDPNGLFTMDADCKACKYSKDIERDGNMWCDTVQSIVSNPALASCIKGKCAKAKIACSDPGGHCNPQDVLGYAWAGDQEIHLCTQNWSTGLGAGAIVVHEFAHTCGWGHGQGFNVPGSNGTLNPYSYGHALY
jgi:hypothetical protein